MVGTDRCRPAPVSRVAPLRAERADAFEPLALLNKHHATEPETSTTTALLLLTDRRWRVGLTQLVRQIADSGVLESQHLDVLAEAFLTAERWVYWTVPDEWFSDEPITIAVYGDDAAEEEDDDASAEEGPTLAAREVAPPLRRWAAARHLSQEPATWPELLARARDLDARNGAAVVAGMLDSIGSLPAAAQILLVEQGATWPHHNVRRAAFELVAARDGVPSAYQLAHDDPNAQLRAWAATLSNPRPGPPADGEDGAQPSLF